MQETTNNIAELIIMVLVVILGRSIYVNLNDLYKKNSTSPIFNIQGFYVLIACLAGWLIILGALAKFDFFDNFSPVPPHMLLAFLPPLIFAIILGFSKKISAFLKYVPAFWLVIIQSFRIVVEIALWQLNRDGRVPVQMTFEGWNFDIVTGITALIMGYLIYKNRIGNGGIIAWNIFGLILLANIITISILSMPTPFRVFMNEPANVILTQYPFIWIPGFLVPFAYSMHILSIKKAIGELK